MAEEALPGNSNAAWAAPRTAAAGAPAATVQHPSALERGDSIGSEISHSESLHLEVVSRWKVIFSFVLLTGVTFASIALFSDTFESGKRVIDGLLEYAAVGASSGVLGAVLFIATLLYIFDISYWKAKCGSLTRRAVLVLLALAVCAYGLSMVRSVPYFPLTLMMFGLPLAGLSLRLTVLRGSSASGSSWVLGASFLFASFVCLLVWLLWLFGAFDGERQFWFSNRLKFSRAAHCNETDEWGGDEPAGYTVVDGVPICTAAFLLWVSPFILFGVTLFIGLFLMLLTRMITAADAKSTQFAVKALGTAVFATMFAMYSSTSVGGANLELANVAMAVFAVMLIGIVIVAGATVGWDALAKKIEKHGSVNRMGPTTRNLVHAFAFFFGMLPFLLFIVLSFVNQQVRRCACACGVCKELKDDKERQQQLTALAKKKITLMTSWDWGKVLEFTYWICFLCWLMIFFSKMTYIFFNWLVSVLRVLDFAVVVVIFIFIGLSMFLIPVVPGPAVYLTAGVLMVPLGKGAFLKAAAGGNGTAATFDACAPEQEGDGSDDGAWAFWASCAVASGLSFALKLVAHVLQQKLIGETFRSRVAVRAFVAPNSIQMKAARYILSQPGITIAKSSILCGGPDWPTSVICGLLSLNCCSMLVGLTPIIIFTTPGTLLGAFMTEKAYKEYNLDTVCVMIVLLVQTLMGVTFLHYVNRVIAEKQDVLNSYEEDKEVAALDAKAAEFAAVVAKVGNFHQAPPAVRLIFVSGVVASTLSTYALMMGASHLFQKFAITDCRDNLGNDGETYIIPQLGIKPLGLIFLLFMVYGYGTLKYYERWVTNAANKRIVGLGPAPAAVAQEKPEPSLPAKDKLEPSPLDPSPLTTPRLHYGPSSAEENELPALTTTPGGARAKPAEPARCGAYLVGPSVDARGRVESSDGADAPEGIL